MTFVIGAPRTDTTGEERVGESDNHRQQGSCRQRIGRVALPQGAARKPSP